MYTTCRGEKPSCCSCAAVGGTTRDYERKYTVPSNQASDSSRDQHNVSPQGNGNGRWDGSYCHGNIPSCPNQNVPRCSALMKCCCYPQYFTRQQHSCKCYSSARACNPDWGHQRFTSGKHVTTERPLIQLQRLSSAKHLWNTPRHDYAHATAALFVCQTAAARTDARPCFVHRALSGVVTACTVTTCCIAAIAFAAAGGSVVSTCACNVACQQEDGGNCGNFDRQGWHDKFRMWNDFWKTERFCLVH